MERKRKQPVLLTVLIEAQARRWFVAGLADDGTSIPLIRSERDNLIAPSEAVDEQVHFLRHRLSGVLQRGCDRLWALEMKPSHVIFIADSELDPAHPEVTQWTAEHFYQWLTSPPVTFYRSENEFAPTGAKLEKLAGELGGDDENNLLDHLGSLFTKLSDESLWELLPNKRAQAAD